MDTTHRDALVVHRPGPTSDQLELIGKWLENGRITENDLRGAENWTERDCRRFIDAIIGNADPSAETMNLVSRLFGLAKDAAEITQAQRVDVEQYSTRVEEPVARVGTLRPISDGRENPDGLSVEEQDPFPA
jgi:hypothetical protein